MSRIIGSVLQAPCQSLFRAAPSALPFVPVRQKSRAKKYGSEPGFDIKNEVRKERWIIKNSPRRLCGGSWREEMGSDKHANRTGPLYSIPDYRYPDGTPGVPSFTKVTRMMEQKEYAVQIKEALDFVKFSQDAVRSNEMNKIKEFSKFKKSHLKSKGKLFVTKNN